MNNIKSKIVTYKIIKKFSSINCFTGVLGFVLFSLGDSIHIFRNGWISIVLMLSGFLAIEYCNYRVQVLKKQYSTLKSKRVIRSKVIDFNKIA